jgi:hydrogenase maturation factor HypF (carbamoyltransferase family)
MIKQTIQFNSPNKYFGGFLQDIIIQSQIKGSVSQADGKIILKVDENDPNLEKFNQNLAKYLPHSLFLGDIDTKQSDEQIEDDQFKSPTYNIAPCNRCLSLLNDPSSPSYLDESLQCNHYSNDKDTSYEDFTIFSPHYSEGSAVLVTDSEKIHELFILTQDETKALFSIEKPTLKATIKDETLKELTGKNYIYIKAPYNNRSSLAALNAKESGVEYLFFEDKNDLKVVVVQKNTTIVKASRVATELKNLNDDLIINRFLNIKEEANFTKGAIGAYLSTKEISFLVSNELDSKKVITFQDFDLQKLLQNFENDSKRKKLFSNLESKYPQVVERLQNNSSFNLYETISILLELDTNSIAFNTLSNKGYEFRGNGGLKIDTNFVEDGFDYDSFIGSIISFKLAGAETHYIAYSIFEALADMAINTLNQLKEKFKLENIVMMGDMFENSVLYSRILSKYQLANPYFAKAIAMDD